MRTLAIVNQKGGSGKTTTALALAGALSHRRSRTLLVDLDPQGHCALGLAIPEGMIEPSIADALLAPPGAPLDPASLIWSLTRHLDLAPSNASLAAVESARGGLAEASDRDLRVRRFLSLVEHEYEWCVIDCPPAIGLLTFNALRAADCVVIPVETGYFALRGAEKQVATINAVVRRSGSPIPSVVVPVRHDPADAVSRDVLAAMARLFGDRVIPGAVHEDAALREAAALGVPILEHAPESTAASDYNALASWLTEHVRASEDRLGEVVITDRGRVVPRRGEGPGPVPGFGARSAPVSVDGPPSGVGGSVRDDRVMSRAAELAARTRRLLSRSEAQDAARLAGERVREALSVAGVHTERVRGPEAAYSGEGTLTARDPASGPARVQDEEAEGVRPLADAAAYYGVRVTRSGVLFVFPASAEACVSVAGDFNGWADSAHRMAYNPALLAHQVCVPCARGRYRYRYVVDGRWTADPHNPLSEPNPYGELDSIVDIRGSGD